MKRVLRFATVGLLIVAAGAGFSYGQSLYDPSAIDSLQFEVLDGADGALLASSSASWGSLWILNGIPAGMDRVVRVTTFDAEGRRTYWGELAGLAIKANIPLSPDGALIFMAVPEGIYVLIPPFTPAGVMVLYPFSIEVAIDIKPGSTANPFNTRSAGVTPVAVLGGPDTDVTALDTATLRLGGVPPARTRVSDVCTLNEDGDEISTEGPDGFADLMMHFDNAALAIAVGDAADGEFVPLVLTGSTLDGVHVEGLDGVVVIRPPTKSSRGR